MDSNLRCGLLDHKILWIIKSYGKLHPRLISNSHRCHPVYSKTACLCMISISYVLTRSFFLLSWELMTCTILRMMTSTRGLTLSLDYTIVKTHWNILYTCYCHLFFHPVGTAKAECGSVKRQGYELYLFGVCVCVGSVIHNKQDKTEHPVWYNLSLLTKLSVIHSNYTR